MSTKNTIDASQNLAMAQRIMHTNKLSGPVMLVVPAYGNDDMKAEHGIGYSLDDTFPDHDKLTEALEGLGKTMKDNRISGVSTILFFPADGSDYPVSFRAFENGKYGEDTPTGFSNKLISFAQSALGHKTAASYNQRSNRPNPAKLN